MSNASNRSPTTDSNQAAIVRLISWTLVIAIVVAALMCIAQSVLFALNYIAAIEEAKDAPHFPGPGSVALAESPSPSVSIVVSDQERQILESLAGDLTYAESVISSSTVLPKADPVGYVQSLAGSIRQGDLTPGQNDRQLQALLEMDVQSDARIAVVQTLQQLVDSPGRASARLIGQVAEKWVPRDNYRLHQQIRSLQARSSNASLNRGRLIAVNLQPEIIAQRQTRRSVPRVAVRATDSNRKTRVGGNAQGSNDTAEPISLDDALAALGDQRRREAMLAELAMAASDEPIRQRLIEHAAPLLENNKALDSVPDWYSRLAVVWRDSGMLETLRGCLGSQANQVTNEVAMQVSHWARASGDRRWVPAILNWLPPLPADPAPDRHIQIFRHDSWQTNIAETLHTLMGDNLGTCVERLDDPNVAGSIVRQVLIWRSQWPQAVAESIVQSAKTGNPSAMDWLQLTRVDEGTRQRITRIVSSLDDEELRKSVWKKLLPVIHPCQVAPTCGQVLEEDYRQGKLWYRIDSILSSEVDSGLETLANVVAEEIPQGDGSDRDQRNAGYRKLDSRFAGLLLRGTVGKGESFLDVAERFAGWNTANLLESDVGKEVATKAGWPEERVSGVIDLIRDRTGSNGF